MHRASSVRPDLGLVPAELVGGGRVRAGGGELPQVGALGGAVHGVGVDAHVFGTVLVRLGHLRVHRRDQAVGEAAGGVDPGLHGGHFPHVAALGQARPAQDREIVGGHGGGVVTEGQLALAVAVDVDVGTRGAGGGAVVILDPDGEPLPVLGVVQVDVLGRAEVEGVHRIGLARDALDVVLVQPGVVAVGGAARAPAVAGGVGAAGVAP